MTILYPNPCYNEVCYKGTVLYLFTDKGATYEFRVLARNEIDYGERAVTRIDTPDGGLYFLHFCIYVCNILCCGHIIFYYH